MFKLGVMTTVMGFLTLISIKILIIGVILLVSHLSAFLAKLHVLKHDHGWEHSGHGWSPQDVHVHLHHDQHTPPIYHHHGHHGGWDKTDSSGPGGPYQSYQMERLNYLKNLYENYRNNLYQQEIRWRNWLILAAQLPNIKQGRYGLRGKTCKSRFC